MSTDIKISELNEITNSCDLNFIIVNDRDNTGEEGITKKIQLGNLLTDNIVKSNNIQNRAVTSGKIALRGITCDNIACNTITDNEIKPLTISSSSLSDNSVDSRVFDPNHAYAMTNLSVNPGILHIQDPVNGQLNVESGRTRLNGVPYRWPTNSGPVNYFLQTVGNGQLKWAQASVGDSPGLVVADIMPVGTIVPWAGAGALPDNGKWILLDGTHDDGGGPGTFSGTLYPELSAVLGSTWGTPNNGHYVLPNFAGRVVVGTGTHSDGQTSCTFNKTDTSGEYRHQLSEGEMPAHTHTLSQLRKNTNVAFKDGFFDRSKDGGNAGYSTDITGGNEYHNNIQPYTSTSYIIKAKKDDLVQFTATVGNGLSARDAGGQTSTISLTSTEIGLSINPGGLEFDGTNRLKVGGDLSDINSITYGDGTVQTTYERMPFYTVEIADARGYTQPSDFTTGPGSNNAVIRSTHSEFTRGSISHGNNNHPQYNSNSVLYTMNVKVLEQTFITLANYKNDDYFRIFVNGTQVGETYKNYSNNNNPRQIPLNLSPGYKTIQIVKNDNGQVNNSFELIGDIIGSTVLFLSGK